MLTTLVTGLMLSVAGPATADPGQWDPTLPAAVSAGAPGDPLAVANASLQATAQATQTTLDLGKQFLGGLGINLGGTDPRRGHQHQPRPDPAGQRPAGHRVRDPARRVADGRAVFVGRRHAAGSQQGRRRRRQHHRLRLLGPDAIRFAGVGVLIPRFSGDQYNAGRHIPPNEARRGDLIFYGPGGGQHVTMYLGNGQMLEASGSAGKVTVSPVRKPGMTPFLTRIIEY